MAELSTALSYPFMRYALLAGVLIALLGGWYGVFVVQRRLAFLGHGLAHAAFGGVGLGLFLGVSPVAVALPFTVIVALAITYVSSRTKLAQDTAIGILFSLSLALGIVFLSLKRGFAADAYTFLFGSILSVTAADLLAATALVALALLAAPLWGRWAYATFDRDSARADRLPVRFDDYALAALIAATVVVAVKIVGALLVSAFLVIPAAAARLVSRRFSQMTLVAMGLALVSAVGGLLGSYFLDLPSGATIVLAQTLLFGVCWAAGRGRH